MGKAVAQGRRGIVGTTTGEASAVGAATVSLIAVSRPHVWTLWLPGIAPEMISEIILAAWAAPASRALSMRSSLLSSSLGNAVLLDAGTSPAGALLNLLFGERWGSWVLHSVDPHAFESGTL